ncbi:MAG: hypothetical protein AB8F78_06815 [Saprospiraceae bacterium]
MWKLYALFWIILFVVFGLVQDAGYVTDYLGWQARVQEGGLQGALHTYDYPAQLQGYALLMWLIEQLRGVSTWLVHAFNVSLFAGGATLLFELVQKVLHDHNNPNSTLAAGLAAMLYVFSPTNTEIMIWRVCPHYFVSILVWLGTLLLLRSYVREGSKKHLASAMALQTVGLFCLELAYALPIAVFGWVAYYYFFLRSGSTRRAALAFGSSVALVALHLMLTKLVQGAWIGHYGADVATSQPLSEIIAAPWRWISRAGLQYRFWATPWKKWLTAALGNPVVSLALYGFVALLTGRAIQLWLRFRKTRQTPPAWTPLLLWVFLAGAGTAAVSQLYYFDQFIVDTDRFGALAVVFTTALIATGLSLIRKRALLTALAIPIILVNSLIFAKNLYTWTSSQAVLTGLSSSFSKILKEADLQKETPTTVYLLGYARTFNGVHLLGDNREGQSALAGHLASSVSGNDQLSQDQISFVDIAQFHQLSVTDSIKPRWENGKLIVVLDAPGSWLMYKDLGVKNRRDEDNQLDVHVGKWSIQVTWDSPPPANTIFLYQASDHFVRLPYPVAEKSPRPDPTVIQ